MLRTSALLILLLAPFSHSSVGASSPPGSPYVQSRLLSSHANSYAVALKVVNAGAAALDSSEVVWVADWSDHVGDSRAYLDWSDVPGASLTVEELADYRALYRIRFPSLAAGASSEFHLRLANDQGSLDPGNDSSFAGIGSSFALSVSTPVLRNGIAVWGSLPKAASYAAAKLSTLSRISALSELPNQLGFSLLVKNTGKFPVRGVKCSYFTAGGVNRTADMVLDWSSARGARAWASERDSVREWVVDLSGQRFSAGEEHQVDLRLFLPSWSQWQYRNDPGYKYLRGLQDGYFKCESGGLVREGKDYSLRDLDGDGCPDEVEERLGTDPLNGSSRPEGTWVPSTQVSVGSGQDSVKVSYDFGAVQGYDSGSRATMSFKATAIQGAVPQFISLNAPDLSGFPVWEARPLGRVMDIRAALAPGDSADVWLPIPPGSSRFPKEGGYAVMHRTKEGRWERLEVQEIKEGFVRFRAGSFSPFVLVATLPGNLLSGYGDHMVAIPDPAGGEVYSWGSGRSGLFGNGSTPDRPSEELVRWTRPEGAGPMLMVAAGDGFSFASDGRRVYCWGSNQSRACSQSGAASYSLPVPVDLGLPSGSEIVRIVAGADFGAALLSDGGVYTWGTGSSGALGREDGQWAGRVPLASPLSFLSAGSHHVAGLGPDFSDRRVYGWGDNSSGALGIRPDCSPGLACPAGSAEISQPTEIELADGSRVAFDLVSSLSGLAAGGGTTLVQWNRAYFGGFSGGGLPASYAGVLGRDPGFGYSAISGVSPSLWQSSQAVSTTSVACMATGGLFASTDGSTVLLSKMVPGLSSMYPSRPNAYYCGIRGWGTNADGQAGIAASQVSASDSSTPYAAYASGYPEKCVTVVPRTGSSYRSCGKLESYEEAVKGYQTATAGGRSAALVGKRDGTYELRTWGKGADPSGEAIFFDSTILSFSKKDFLVPNRNFTITGNVSIGNIPELKKDGILLGQTLVNSDQWSFTPSVENWTAGVTQPHLLSVNVRLGNKIYRAHATLALMGNLPAFDKSFGVSMGYGENDSLQTIAMEYDTNGNAKGSVNHIYFLTDSIGDAAYSIKIWDARDPRVIIGNVDLGTWHINKKGLNSLQWNGIIDDLNKKQLMSDHIYGFTLYAKGFESQVDSIQSKKLKLLNSENQYIYNYIDSTNCNYFRRNIDSKIVIYREFGVLDSNYKIVENSIAEDCLTEYSKKAISFDSNYFFHNKINFFLEKKEIYLVPFNSGLFKIKDPSKVALSWNSLVFSENFPGIVSLDWQVGSNSIQKYEIGYYLMRQNGMNKWINLYSEKILNQGHVDIDLNSIYKQGVVENIIFGKNEKNLYVRFYTNLLSGETFYWNAFKIRIQK